MSFIQQLRQDLKNDLIAGLLVVIPLATTIWLTITVATWVIDVLTQVPKQLNPFNGLNPWLVNLLNLTVGFAVPLLCILSIGLMARNIAGRWLLDLGETILQATPFAGPVYKTLKQLLETLLKDSSSKFRRVVLIEYPRKGIWTIAFVTSTLTAGTISRIPESLIGVFIPTTPNPATGWYALVPESDVVDLSISIEDAFKVLISGGIVSSTSLASSTSLDSTNLEAAELGAVELGSTNEHSFEGAKAELQQQILSHLPYDADRA